jgi:hypothetical protein
VLGRGDDTAGDPEADAEPPTAGNAVEARVSGIGLGESVWECGRSQRPAVDWLRVMRSRSLCSRPADEDDGSGDMVGRRKLLFKLLGVGGVMPLTITVEPLLEPEPARAPALDAGRRKPDAREALRLPTASQLRTNSSAIWRTRIAGSWLER